MLRLDVAIPPWVGHGTAPPRNRGRGEPCRCSREQRCPYWPSLSRPRAELEVTAGAGDDTHAAHTSSDSDGGDCLLSSFSKKISCYFYGSSFCTLQVLGRRALTRRQRRDVLLSSRALSFLSFQTIHSFIHSWHSSLKFLDWSICAADPVNGRYSRKRPRCLLYLDCLHVLLRTKSFRSS